MSAGAWLAVTMPEPPREQDVHVSLKGATARQQIALLLGDLRTPTFCTILSQGCFGAVPGNAMSFLTLFFQVAGISAGHAAVLQSFQLASSAYGRLMGGKIGDTFARKWPNHGRPFVAQITVFSGIPLSACLFLASPPGVCFLVFFDNRRTHWRPFNVDFRGGQQACLI